MKNEKSLNIGFLMILLAVTMMFSAVSVNAQYEPAIKAFKVGERVEVNVANDVFTQDNWVKGTVKEIIYTDDNRILSYKVNTAKAGESPYTVQYGNKARVIRPLSGDAGDETNTTAGKEAPVPTNAGDSSATNADCSFENYPELKSSMKFSEELVKNALYGRYSFEKDTGGLSSPLAIGLTFLNIKLLDSYTNTVTVVPGRGAQRKHDGAPVNATVYRFHAKYIVCRKYSNTTRRTQYESDNVCFKAGNGNWDCPVDSVPKITELN